MRKKAFGLLLMLLCLSVFALCAGAATVGTDSDGDGVYELSTAEQIKELADLVAAGDPARAGKYILTEDIDMSSISEQIPIGTASAAFTGSFDGAGHTVSGISLTGSATSDRFGFFGRIASATIQNLTVEGTVSTSGYAGGLVGLVAGASTIQNCVNLCDVTGGVLGTGGLVGYASANVALEACVNAGTVQGSRYVGGLIGQSAKEAVPTVKRSLNTGVVEATSQSGGNADLGGIIGLTYTLSVTDCVNLGEIIAAHASAKQSVGGIVGRAAYSAASEISNCYNGGAVTAAASGYTPAAILGRDGSTSLSIVFTNNTYKAGCGDAATPRNASATAAESTDEPVIAGVHVHAWDAGTVTTAPTVGAAGVITYTCTICEAEGITTVKTASIPALPAALTQQSITAVKVNGVSTMRFVAKLELAEGVTVKKCGIYVALVALDEDGNPTTEGARVAVREQNIELEASTSFALDLTDIPEAHAETTVYAWSYAELSDGTRLSFAFDGATVASALAARQ